MTNVLDSFRLDGKVALVTGGAGLYGRQIAEAVAEAGAKTFIASRGIEALEQQAIKFRDAGLDVTALQLDQSKEDSVRSLLEQIVDTAGQADVLVNNAVARTMVAGAPRYEAFAKSQEINATGILMMTEIFGRHMAERETGSIINVGSIYGMLGPDLGLYVGTGMHTPNQPDYWFNKGGMMQLTRYAAAMYGPSGVRVNTISPGGFFDGQPELFVERYNAKTFLGRMANEQDLKGVIVFLASDASGYITGVNIPVDAGLSAK
ncbi:MAG: SDR family oxidoreductase [Planctomycetota bacterium]|nr:SDR family oxidoreductase [Planctomycetota bacterium]